MAQESHRLPYGDGRDALLSAVVEVVAEKGLRGATYRSVAARAGVNHALVTHHFGSMEGLLVATMEWSVRRSIQETGLTGVADFEGNFADSLIESVSAEPELQLFQFEMILESRRNPRIRAMVEHLYASYVETVEDALKRRGLDTGNEASLAIFAALDGLMLQFVTFGNPAKIRAAVSQVGQMVSVLGPANGAAGEPTVH
ncbi:TetR/AcrR family transcriptional regulator [Arthrobacter sp. efr-133-TYG-104]|uniref:TetR/AcrR family transcriptional regulator n=1 Tax=Arthrobacter sp. efr-133-TYG-104 TaxID=3040324 RepID=UPI00254FCB56|nr:TetR/AcrR family transcriptional regulator [Arthrobacter sp. efr-133-TYG-104]